MTTAYAIAAILRFLTPSTYKNLVSSSMFLYKDDVTKYLGWLEGSYPYVNESHVDPTSCSSSVLYADQLYYNLDQGWYQFRCTCIIPYSWEDTNKNTHSNIPLSQALWNYISMNPRSFTTCKYIIRQYLMVNDGCNLSCCFEDGVGGRKNARYVEESIEKLIDSVAILYDRMISGEGMLSIMDECCKNSNK